MTLDQQLISTADVDPNLKKTRLEELRARIKETENLETRTDDVFLTQFLRAKGYQLNSAFYMVKAYQSYNDKYTDGWLRVERPLVQQVLSTGMLDMFPGSDALGRRICWLRIGRWQPRDLNFEVALQISALLTQAALADPYVPMNSLVAIFDMKDTGFTHAKAVTPSLAKKMVAFMTACIPMHIQEIHIVRESTVLSMMYAVFKIFLSDSMKKRIHLHGSSLESLHKFVEKRLLPAELDGDAPDVDPNRWNEVLHEPSTIKELDKAGFQILDP